MGDLFSLGPIPRGYSFQTGFDPQLKQAEPWIMKEETERSCCSDWNAILGLKGDKHLLQMTEKKNEPAFLIGQWNHKNSPGCPLSNFSLQWPSISMDEKPADMGG